MAGARNYLIVTASYWSFTLTDGALRMLVLLHFYSLGYTPFTEDPVMWFKHLVIPWITLALLYIGLYARILRSALVEAEGQDFVRTARSKGISEQRVLGRHFVFVDRRAARERKTDGSLNILECEGKAVQWAELVTSRRAPGAWS